MRTISTMSKPLLSAVSSLALALATGSALAQSATPPASTSPATTSSAATTAAANGTLASTATTQKPGLTRAQVQAEYLEARKNGTLIETEADMDVAQTRKHFAK